MQIIAVSEKQLRSEPAVLAECGCGPPEELWETACHLHGTL